MFGSAKHAMRTFPKKEGIEIMDRLASGLGIAHGLQAWAWAIPIT